ncbi:DUF2306 domain-containing protein [Thalassobius sp. S69A]|uniref:DUF2306 domain-containing protein n=1 Tax=unclassified Thalassovita TaxID=2619711 RepID=UPI000C10DBA2|nr:hypothetical protein [Paracoccaceae bacterium]MBA84506.1 hypothetical protein [Paracoccaceae bacterium]MBT27072.1 hypothetical protein [Paracoccaceae bacterium]
MSFHPLAQAPAAIQIHAWIALALIPLTVAIFLIPRGSGLHKTLGWAWVVGMGAVALSSFWIAHIRLIGPFSPIHALSVLTLGALIHAIYSIRARRVSRHRKTMLGLVWGALLGAGAFTVLPGRIMHSVLFGG